VASLERLSTMVKSINELCNFASPGGGRKGTFFIVGRSLGLHRKQEESRWIRLGGPAKW